jgi:hypothetical protein
MNVSELASKSSLCLLLSKVSTHTSTAKKGTKGAAIRKMRFVGPFSVPIISFGARMNQMWRGRRAGEQFHPN